MLFDAARRVTKRWTDEGLETTSKTPGKTQGADRCGAKSGAVGAHVGPVDPQLASVVDAWPRLPEPVKAGILAMIRPAEVDLWSHTNQRSR